MLDQLVESKSHSVENTKRNSLLLGVMAVAVVVLAVSVYRSLTNLYNNLDLGSGDIELSTLVAPVPVEDEPPPKPEEKPKQQVEADVRKELIQNIMSTPIKPPDQTSVVQNKVKEMRTDRLTVLGNTDADTGAQVGKAVAGVTSNAGSSSGDSTDVPKPTTEDAPPPPPKKAPPKTISGGVLNGKAVSLPRPAYPPAARAVRASGAVTVQVLIDEEGRVVSASATGGHPLLQAAAVSAARQARFSPTLLSGQPVKVSGIITYNFVP
jgi:protein TonB